MRKDLNSSRTAILKLWSADPRSPQGILKVPHWTSCFQCTKNLEPDKNRVNKKKGKAKSTVKNAL